MVREKASSLLKVHDEIGPVLMLRSSVAPLFRTIMSLGDSRVVLDFSSVEFMSRSFADEYLSAKAASRKKVEERSASPDVSRMLRLVASSRKSASKVSEVSRPVRVAIV